MNEPVLFPLSTIIIGLGATLTFDLWAQFLKHTFHITPSNICFVGRWLRYMPEGIFIHSNISTVPKKNSECLVGWIAHYLIGISFAFLFISLIGTSWLKHPTLIPAVGYGIVTVIAPFLIMQPSFGFGIAGSKTTHPLQVRIRSLMNHTAFGVGLYIFALLVNYLQYV